MNLSAVRVFVRDVPEAMTFYGERLGLKVTLGDVRKRIATRPGLRPLKTRYSVNVTETPAG